MDLNEARDDRVAAASMYKTTASLLALFLSRELLANGTKKDS